MYTVWSMKQSPCPLPAATVIFCPGKRSARQQIGESGKDSEQRQSFNRSTWANIDLTLPTAVFTATHASSGGKLL